MGHIALQLASVSRTLVYPRLKLQCESMLVLDHVPSDRNIFPDKLNVVSSVFFRFLRVLLVATGISSNVP